MKKSRMYTDDNGVRWAERQRPDGTKTRLKVLDPILLEQQKQNRVPTPPVLDAAIILTFALILVLLIGLFLNL